MESHIPTRQEALALLKEFTQGEGLIKHGLAVEAAMRYFSRQKGEDEEAWGIVGLVHDLDYEQFPREHCQKTQEILRERHWPEAYIRAIMSHGWGICTDVEPQSPMEKVLYAVDELTGLVTATALVRPSRSVMEVTVKSVKKKWKNKAFAAGVDRAVIEKGAQMLGMELGDLMADVIAAMQEVAEELGLQGDESV